MIVVVVTCVVVIVAMVIANLRLRTRADELEDLARSTADERDAARADAADAANDAALVRRQRDEALERGHRSRRDAAQVANRLTAESSARAEVEDQLRSARRDLDEARAAGVGGLADVLWLLSVRQAATTWRMSIAVDPSEPSPLEGCDDQFRAAIEIEVDAAREESGADLELEWAGEVVAPAPERAVVALAVVRDVISELATTSARTTLRVSCLDDAVEIEAESVDAAGASLPVSLPSQIESGPGRARIT